MCGRFTLRARPSKIVEVFGVPSVPEWEARYNIAPTQNVMAIRTTEDLHREAVLLRWGLVPFWADEMDTSGRMINARAETVAVKPAFRTLLRKQRCLVVADGFYEWQKRDGHKQPYFIHRDDDMPFAFAGLWDRWKKQDPPVESCTIITTDANSLMAPIHNRMPVLLFPEDFSLWLDPQIQDTSRLAELLKPREYDALRADPISTYVNNVRNEGPRCIEPIR